MGDVSELSALRREVSILRWSLIALAVILGGAVAWLAVKPPAVPPVLAVERLDIVEPDGQLAFVIANSQRAVAATINGQTLMGGQESERRMPSIIFFDGKGDEVGGMLLGNSEGEGGSVATRHLSFDAFEQDQTVVLAHSQDARGSTAGLREREFDDPTREIHEGAQMKFLKPLAVTLLAVTLPRRRLRNLARARPRAIRALEPDSAQGNPRRLRG